MPAAPAAVDCEAVADLLDALADGELPAPAAAEAERHLAACPGCAAELAATRALRRDLGALRRDAAPEGLRRRVLAALPAAPPEPEPPGMPRRRGFGLVAAGCAGGLLLGFGGARLLGDGGAGLAEHDLLAAHARSLLAEAPPQLAAGDPHRVRPWLSARLPVAPRVGDPEGFPLQGARLDLVEARPVAAVVHRRRAHAITVFAAPAEAARSWPREAATRRGFHLVPWIADGVHYVAVSDLNRAELLELRALLGGG